eukprot:TRINITY_DN15609_c0_g1_i1.p1 TRINITY_DN15609_c0_g1~~TRINITY_DN15609_c0_g1_i1.p1  ORF type:complete len:156 (+),score=10.10 TRINITY_DN15609_c0_g1_i1:255-722(+)
MAHSSIRCNLGDFSPFPGFVFAIRLATQLRCKLGINVQARTLLSITPEELLLVVDRAKSGHDKLSEGSAAHTANPGSEGSAVRTTKPGHGRLSEGSSAHQALPCLLTSLQTGTATKSPAIATGETCLCKTQMMFYPSIQAALDAYGVGTPVGQVV